MVYNAFTLLWKRTVKLSIDSICLYFRPGCWPLKGWWNQTILFVSQSRDRFMRLKDGQAGPVLPHTRTRPIHITLLQVSAATTVTASTTTAPTITQTSPSVPAERGQEFLRAHVAAPAAGGAVFRHELPAPFFANSNGIFRPGFPTFQPPAHQHGSTPPAPAITTAIQNGTATNRRCSSFFINPSMHPSARPSPSTPSTKYTTFTRH